MLCTILVNLGDADAITNLQTALRTYRTPTDSRSCWRMRPGSGRRRAGDPPARRTQPGTSAGCDDAR